MGPDNFFSSAPGRQGLAPTRLCRLLSDLGPAFLRERGSAGLSALHPAQAPQGDGSRVLPVILNGIRRRVARRHVYNEIGQLVRVAGTFWFCHAGIMLDRARKGKRDMFKRLLALFVAIATGLAYWRNRDWWTIMGVVQNDGLSAIDRPTLTIDGPTFKVPLSWQFLESAVVGLAAGGCFLTIACICSFLSSRFFRR